VRLWLFHARQCRPLLCATRFVFALRQVAEDEQVTQTAELTLDCLALPVRFGDLGATLTVRREDADLRVVWQPQSAKIELSRETYEATRCGESVQLTPLEFRILYLLAMN
jgi:DNA-binding response OmpR family regulator